MTDKQARKLDKLLETHKEARSSRKAAAASRGKIEGVHGRDGTLAALVSPEGVKAVEAELIALKAERRALKKLHAFAVKSVARAMAKTKAVAADIAQPTEPDLEPVVVAKRVRRAGPSATASTRAVKAAGEKNA